MPTSWAGWTLAASPWWPPAASSWTPTPRTSTAGCVGINGSNAAQALSWLTGAPASANAFDRTSVQTTLDTVNEGKVVRLATKLGKSRSLAPGLNILSSHAYTLLSTGQGDQGNPTVTLRNPWGVNTDADGKRLAGTNDVFMVPAASLPDYFNIVFSS